MLRVNATPLARPARRPVHLLLKHLFDLADFLLDLAGEVFVLAFGRQVGVARQLSRFLFDFAFHLMKLASNLILCARFHAFSCVSGAISDSTRSRASPNATTNQAIARPLLLVGFSQNSRPRDIE